MKINHIIWLDHIIDKLEQKHHVLQYEVEQTLNNKPHISKIQKGHVQGEDVYRALGKTDEGRYLVIFFIIKKNETLIVLSGREMDAKERRLYGRKKH